jgi:hypothetical protein
MRLIEAINKVTSDPHATHQEIAARLQALGNEGAHRIDLVTLPHDEVDVLGPEVDEEGCVRVRYRDRKTGCQEIGMYRLTNLGDRRRKGSRTHRSLIPAWREPPWQEKVRTGPVPEKPQSYPPTTSKFGLFE